MTNWSKKILLKFILPTFTLGTFFYSSLLYNAITKTRDNSLSIINKKSEILSKTLGILINNSHGIDNQTYIYFLNSISFDREIIDIKIKDSERKIIFHKKAGIKSPEGFFELLSYYFYENDTLTVSKKIFPSENNNPPLSKDSYRPIGNIEVSSVTYLPFSRVMKDVTLIYSLFLIIFFVFLFSIIVIDLKVSTFIKSLNCELKKERPDHNNIYTGNSKDIKIAISDIVNIIKKSKKLCKTEVDKYEHVISILSENVDNLNVKIDKSIIIRKDYLKIFNDISHDIKSPLHVIKTFSSKLKEKELSKGDLRYLNSIEQSANEIEALSKNITDDYLMSSEELFNKQTPIDILDLIGSKAANYREKALEKGIELYYHIPTPSMPNYVTVNWSVLSRAINNLLDNAIKYSYSGKIVIEIKVANSMLNISIKDHGIGISSNNIPKIFDPYFQVDRKNNGYGLGLSIVKKSIETIGGTVEIASVRGEGTTFNLNIPINIISKYSPRQTRIKNSVQSLEIYLYIIDNNSELINGIYNQLILFGFKVDKIKKTNESHDKNKIIIGFELSKYNGEIDIKKFKNSLSIERKNIQKIDNVNNIMSLTTTIYDLSKKIISISENMKITRIGLSNSSTESSENAISSPMGILLNQLSEENNGPLFGYKILLIDDHKGSSDVTALILQELGASVIEEYSYKNVIDRINSLSFDFIVTDFNLIGYDGIDVYKIANQSNRNHNTPIVCHSGDESIKSKDGTSNVFYSIISKPSSKAKWIKATSTIKRKERKIKSV